MGRWGWMAAALALWAGPSLAANVGFETISVPVPGDRALAGAVWYPTAAPEAPNPLGPALQLVALGAPVSAGAHPLIVISHGTGGWYGDHYDTARALAQAGFVVAAVSHTGDTFDDHSRALRVAERPGHLVRLVDFMEASWPSRGAIDPGRVGAFGFSSGGFTVLAAIGGEPDLTRIGPHCQAHPAFFDCNLNRQFAGQATAPGAAVVHDPRIRAAVVAAPALGFTFAPDGLRSVNVPVQLWRAEQDSVLPQPFYAEAVRGRLPTPPDYRVVPGADHFDFLPPCSEGLRRIAPQICVEHVDRAVFHQAFNAEVVRFFHARLP